MSANTPVYANVVEVFTDLNAWIKDLSFVRGDFCFSVASVARARLNAASVVLIIVLLPDVLLQGVYPTVSFFSHEKRIRRRPISLVNIIV